MMAKMVRARMDREAESVRGAGVYRATRLVRRAFGDVLGG